MTALSTESPAIEFRNVSVSFDETPALINVSFRLERGEMIFLTGASGSGKSVLLRLAMGLLRPDEGEIFVEGREIDKLDEAELLAVRGGAMGMVFQEESLFTGMSVYDNAAYRLDEHGWSAEDIEQAVGEVLHFVGLEGEGDSLPEELSGGMKRRVEIARAMIGWPEILLLDEPTLSLDPLVAVEVLDLIIRARDLKHASALYVTKRLQEIPYLADFRAVKDDQGAIEIREVSTPQEKPRTKAIVLEAGGIVFTGSATELQACELPAVTELTHAEHGTPISNFWAADPWDKRRKPKEKIL